MSSKNCFRIPNNVVILLEQILSDEGYWKCFCDDQYTFYVHEVGNTPYLVGEFSEESDIATYIEWQRKKISDERNRLKDLRTFFYSKEYEEGKSEYEKICKEDEEQSKLLTDLTEHIYRYEEEQLEKIESCQWEDEEEEFCAYAKLQKEISRMFCEVEKTKDYKEVEKRKFNLHHGKYKKYSEIDDLLLKSNEIDVAIDMEIKEFEQELKMEQEEKTQEYKRLLHLFEKLLSNNENLCFGQVDDKFHFNTIKIGMKKRYQEITMEELAGLKMGYMIELWR